jgi:hypothetical protein
LEENNNSNSDFKKTFSTLQVRFSISLKVNNYLAQTIKTGERVQKYCN